MEGQGQRRDEGADRVAPRRLLRPRSPRSPAQYLKKGSQVYVEGALRTRKWHRQGRPGALHHRDPRRHHADAGLAPRYGRRRWPREAPPAGGARRQEPQGAPSGGGSSGGGFGDMDDDIPF
ncbi:MAG: single-stranded DNA-binding protein [Comamonadaceae bacterium]|nr:single-stranded DNA-binding protein [Comamonadaceae bacterium]